jgi:YegS/Rv2252/BmrU family lipid kinase
MQSAVIIYNLRAGRRREQRMRDVAAAQRILLEAGIEAELQQTRGPGTATALAREALAAGKQLIVCCGGDGTINEVANGMAGSQTPLAILPSGTANILAKELGIPWEIPAAARLISRSTPRRIALGRIQSGATGAARYFVCVGGAGPDGMLVYSVDERLKTRTGQGAYWWEGFRQLFRYSFPLFRATSPDLDSAFAASMAIVGRTKHYGGPFQITTGASLFEERFEVVLVATRNRWRYLSYLPAIWRQTLRHKQGAYFFKTSLLRCEPAEAAPIYAQVDGEPAGKLPCEFSIVPDALTLMVPEVTRLWKP